jgi:hypothetical protein
MKRISFVTTLLLFLVLCGQAQRKGITVAFQYNAQKNVYESGNTTQKDLVNGIGIGININKNIARIPIAIEPRLMLNTQKVSSGGASNLKTTYIQVPVSINILGLTKRFYDDLNNQNKAFVFGLNAGVYMGVGIGGKFKNSAGQTVKMKYGEGSTDNRALTDFGLHFSASFGSNVSGFRGYIQVQRGLNNVIPNARIVNGESRKLNGVNMGVSFRIKTKR